MKKFIGFILIIMCGWVPAIGQTANPYLSINMNPPVLDINTNGTLQGTTGNFGNDNIVANSLRITISVGTNAEILGLQVTSDPRWSVFNLSAGPANTIVLTNTTGTFGPFDLGTINVTVRGVVAAGSFQTITGNITYITGPNPLLGGAQSAVQGNTVPADDNSTSSLLVTNILPVGLADISVSGSSCNGIVTWKTASEQNVDRFEIEYSTTGAQFITVGTVQAKNIPSGASYKYAYDQGTGRAYYRLKIVDRDGNITYSKIVSVATQCSGQKSVTIYPNPLTVNQNLTLIASGYEGAIKGELVSMSGQIIRVYTLKNGTNILPVERIAQATYMLRVTDASGASESFKVVVVK